MSARTHNAFRFRRGDSIWWGLASLLGLWSMWVPQVLRSGMDHRTQSFLVSGGMLLGGVFLGFFRPDRPWRWGIASMLLLPIGDLAWMVRDPEFNVFSPEHVLPYVTAHAPLYLFHALPVFLGAYGGSFLADGTRGFDSRR